MASRDDRDAKQPGRLPRTRRRGRWIALSILGLALAFVAALWAWMVRMPGASHSGSMPPLTAAEQAMSQTLRRHVEMLAKDIGERHGGMPQALDRAGAYVAVALAGPGLQVEVLPFEAGGQIFVNYQATLRGSSDEVVVVGAHYDGAVGTPAANDNGSGVAALLLLARAAADKAAAGRTPRATLRFVAFSNEEPPHFQARSMGSLVYAERCKQAGDRIGAMLSLETMGYYDDAPGSQAYPFPMSVLYPDVGNFIGFVGDLSSRSLVHRVVGSFRAHTPFPSEGAVLPASIPGVGWSDHWSFWQQGYPALMVTDTAPFRYPHYHTPQDTPAQVDFERLARVVAGLERVIDELAGVPPP